MITASKPQTYIYKSEEDKQYRVGTYTEPVNESYEDKLKRLAKYEPVIPQAPLDTRFHIQNPDGSLGIRAKFKLVRSIEELRELSKQAVGQIVGMDTETTGLSYYKDKIVGFSFAFDDMSGYYVPIRHQIRTTTVVKENKVDENGNFIYTKTGKISQHQVKTHVDKPYPNNLPDKEALDILYEMMLSAKFTLWHNSEFDLNMIKAEGYDLSKCKTFDTMILPYIYDAEGKGIAGLKALEKRLLGRYRIGFKETVGSDENFQFTDPEKSYEYAATDSSSVIAIYRKLFPMVKDLLAQAPSILTLDGKKYNIVEEDNKLIRAFVDYYGHATMKIDSAEARRYEKMVKEGLAKVTEEIFAYFGRGPFNLSTQSKEFKQVMADAHIDTGAITEKGKTIAFGKNGIKEFNKNLSYLKNNVFPNIKYIKFNTEDKNGSKLPKNGHGNSSINIIAGNLVRIIKTYGRDYCKWVDQVNNLVIKNLDGSKCTRLDFYNILKNMYHGEMKKLGVLQKIKDYSSYMKALNSYIAKLTEVDHCRMRYNLISTSSGRMSSGLGKLGSKNKENSYYINLNAQNLTKPKQVFYEASPSDEPDNILGYKFTYVSDDYAHANKDTKIIVEAGSPDANIRKCIVAPEGRYVVSMDFCVSPETTVELEDGSVQPITCLENNPQKVKTPNGFEMAHNFHYTGKKQKCILTLKDGKKIVCSPDHKFLVRVGETEAVWKPLREIKSTDVILN